MNAHGPFFASLPEMAVLVATAAIVGAVIVRIERRMVRGGYAGAGLVHEDVLCGREIPETLARNLVRMLPRSRGGTMFDLEGEGRLVVTPESALWEFETHDYLFRMTGRDGRTSVQVAFHEARTEACDETYETRYRRLRGAAGVGLLPSPDHLLAIEGVEQTSSAEGPWRWPPRTVLCEFDADAHLGGRLRRAA